MLYNRRTVFCIRCTPSVVQKPLPYLKTAQLAEYCREGKNHAILNIHLIWKVGTQVEAIPFHTYKVL